MSTLKLIGVDNAVYLELYFDVIDKLKRAYPNYHRQLVYV